MDQQQQQQQQILTHELGIREKKPVFWSDATKYVEGRGRDGPFVEEVAYIMVTLHRTGA